LARALRRRGFTVYRLGFSEFIKAGGAAKCLTLRLDVEPERKDRRGRAR
jgi:N-dimethylarginine dimethylaminohydrolase